MLVTVIRLSGSLNFLVELVEFLGGLLQLSGEGNDLCILVIAVHQSPVGNHVLVHHVKTGENGGLIGHNFHDPAALQGVDEGDKFLGWGGEAGAEDISDKATLGVGENAGFGMDFLENLKHLGGKDADVILHVRPEFDRVKLDFKMMNLNNGLGLRDLNDLAKKNYSAEDNRCRLLVTKGKFVLVGEEGLERILSNMVPDGE